METVPRNDDPFASDCVRLRTKLNELAKAVGRPATFRVVEDQTNQNVAVRYETFEHVIDEFQAHYLFINAELLREFTRQFLK